MGHTGSGTAFVQGLNDIQCAVEDATPRAVEFTSGVIDVGLGLAEISVGAAMISAAPVTFGASGVVGAIVVTNGGLTVGDGMIAMNNGITGRNDRPIEAQVGQAVGGETGRVVGEIAAAARNTNGARQAVVRAVESPSTRTAVRAAYETATSAQAVNGATARPNP